MAAATATVDVQAGGGDGGHSVTSEGTSRDGGGNACSALKSAYNECFNRWYTDKFLKGQWEKEECLEEWEAYRACLSKRLEDRNLGHLLKVESLLLAANSKR